MPSPRKLRVRAYAKINLGLKLLPRRADGFHGLRTVFQTVALADRLSIEIGPGRGVALALSGDCAGLPAGDGNLAWRAAEMAAAAWGVHGRIAIQLEKRIPSGAGLGGGRGWGLGTGIVFSLLRGRARSGGQKQEQ